jgi:hypothetical protein
MSEREKLVEVMLTAMSEHHSGNFAEAALIVEAQLAALEAAAVRLVPTTWTDDDQRGLNAAVYADAMWYWDDMPMDPDDAISLTGILKDRLTRTTAFKLFARHWRRNHEQTH